MKESQWSIEVNRVKASLDESNEQRLVLVKEIEAGKEREDEQKMQLRTLDEMIGQQHHLMNLMKKRNAKVLMQIYQDVARLKAEYQGWKADIQKYTEIQEVWVEQMIGVVKVQVPHAIKSKVQETEHTHQEQIDNLHHRHQQDLEQLNKKLTELDHQNQDVVSINKHQVSDLTRLQKVVQD